MYAIVLHFIIWKLMCTVFFAVEHSLNKGDVVMVIRPCKECDTTIQIIKNISEEDVAFYIERCKYLKEFGFCDTIYFIER